MQRLDAVVVGGGFTGMAAAAALSARGATVLVLEAQKATAPQFRGELIHPRGVRALDTLGLKAPLFDAGGVRVQGFAVTPDAASEAMVLPYSFEHGPGLGIDHPTMVLTLREVVGARPGVTVLTCARVESFLREGARVVGVKRADGVEHRADLVVVADGRQSKLRAQLGLEPDVRLLSYTVAFGVEGDALLPAPGHGHVFLGAPGPILAYPYADGQVRFCVDVPVGAPKGREALVQYLKSAYAPFVPAALRPAMAASLDARPFEGCATHAISTEACAASGVVLVGDSGGCGHPLTASGMTNAMNDVLTLAGVVAARGPTDEALSEYQRRRYDFVRMRELFTDALYEVFRGHDTGSKALQAGVFQYWRSSERSRATSMNILSGEDVRTATFVKEYARVMGVSAADVLKGVTGRPALRARGARLRSLVTTGYGRIEAAARRTARTVVDRYRLGLHRVP